MPRPQPRGARPLRDDTISSELQRLGISFPIWLFDPTSDAHPRKLDSIPANSRPAQLVGWVGAYWEYGLTLQHPTFAGRTVDPTQKFRTADEVIKRVHFDEKYDENDYEVVLEGGSTVPLSEMSARSIPASRVESIKRRWDHVIMWQKAARFDVFFEAEKESCICVGLAVMVDNIQQLAQIAGVRDQHVDDVPMPAQFEFTDEIGGSAKGIVYNGRFHKDRGIIPTASKEYNDQYLRGTDREGELGTIGRPV
ncbi:hypothetical protein BX600DRAFT_471574 [Xylariales sp. PMI_506]|nr:hypothetical protein BX600DRAFT_471574 [Xylariales sp. PMI_506]